MVDRTHADPFCCPQSQGFPIPCAHTFHSLDPSRRGFVSSPVKIKDFETEAEKPEPWVDGIS